MRVKLEVRGVRMLLDVAPLPSGLAAALLFIPSTTWDALGAGRTDVLLSLAAKWALAHRRPIAWAIGPGGSWWWCGPVAVGGPLHRDLFRALTAPIVRAGGVVAVDFQTGGEIAVAPPRAPRRAAEEEAEEEEEGAQWGSKSSASGSAPATPPSTAVPAAKTAAPQRERGMSTRPAAAPSAAPTDGQSQASEAQRAGA